MNYFEIYEEHDSVGDVCERHWRLIDENGVVYLSSVKNYIETTDEKELEAAKADIAIVYKYLTDP